METEILTIKQVHEEVDWTEWRLRMLLVDIETPHDVDSIRFVVAKLKFLTWATLVQGPEVPEGHMVIHWPDMDWFVDQAYKWDEEALMREISDLIPRYITWLQTQPNLTKRPGREIWRRFAMEW